MIEHPILFNAEMVKAILNGRKTQTRRVIKPQPSNQDYQLMKLIDSTNSEKTKHKGKFYWGSSESPYKSDDRFFKCPYGYNDDLLWVRETFFVLPDESPSLWFKEKDERLFNIYKENSLKPHLYKWKPSIHMPKKYARIWLKIKDIRVERVQDIREEDAEAEGVCLVDKQGLPYKYYKSAFMALWDSINFKRGFGWGFNPYTWVIELERIKK